jgi:4-hydroxymandelate synthase
MGATVAAMRPSSRLPSPSAQIHIDAIEFWVRDLPRTRRLLTARFGFRVVEESACATSLSCGDVDLVLRADGPDSPIGRHVTLHGDTVGDVTLCCSSPSAVAERAAAAGLAVSGPSDEPSVDLLGDGTIRHTLRAPRPRRRGMPPNGLPAMSSVDHLAYCLPFGVGERVAATYEEVFGLERLYVGDSEAVSAFGTGMRSFVLCSSGGSNLTVVLTEPLSDTDNGQIRRFIDAHAGPGLQHAAIAYDELVDAASALRAGGLSFLPVPDGYYIQARRRLADHDLDWDALRELDILVDAEGAGLLFQLFTLPLVGDGGFFFELIHRSGASGFGANNVRALFAAVEAATRVKRGEH